MSTEDKAAEKRVEKLPMVIVVDDRPAAYKRVLFEAAPVPRELHMGYDTNTILPQPVSRPPVKGFWRNLKNPRK